MKIEAPIDFIPGSEPEIYKLLDRGFYFEFSNCSELECAVLADAAGVPANDVITLQGYALCCNLPVWICNLGFLCHTEMRLHDIPIGWDEELEDIGLRLPDDDCGPFGIYPFDDWHVVVTSKMVN